MLDQIDEADKNDDKKLASALHRIKHIEKTRHMHRKITSTLGSKCGTSLARIEVLYVIKGEKIGWRTLCTGKEVHEAIISRNLSHLE